MSTVLQSEARANPGPRSHAEWCRRYRRLKDAADRICQARNNRARKVCKAAGLDPDLLGLHPHNAMCAYNAGQPWPEVNYSLVRKCLWLLDRQWEGHRIVDRWDKRVRIDI